jgi:hypothetical protein
MVSLIHRHVARHARTAGPAPERPPGEQLPERFRPLLARAEKVARGEWADPALEDYYRALRRDFGRWQQEQRNG